MNQSEPLPRPSGPIGWVLAVDRAPVFLSVLLLFLLPFLNRPDGFDPLLPKILLFRIVVYGLLAAYAVQCAQYRRVLFLQAPVWRPWGLLVLYLSVGALGSGYSPAARQALSNGLLPFLWFALVFLLFREVWRVENLLMAFLAGSLGVSFWALGQKAGWLNGPWDDLPARLFEGRVIGGLGNPDFLAGYLLISWPLALALLLRARNPWSRSWWGLTLAANLSAVLLTGSRSGWIGLCVGALVFSVVTFREAAGHNKTWRWAALGFLLVLAAATPFTTAGARLKNAFRADDPGRVFRTQVWSSSWNMIQEHPWFGTGFGTYEAVFPSYRVPALALSEVERSFVVDHAHNLPIEWTAETGIVGLLLAVWFWAAVMAPWWRLTRGNAIPRPLGASAFAVFAGVLASNLFDVNHAYSTTLCPLFMVAAMPSALSQRFHQIEGFPLRLRVWNRGFGVSLLPFAAAAACALFLFQVYRVFDDQAADLNLARAVAESQAKNWGPAVEFYREAVRRQPDRVEAQYFLGSALLDRDQPGDPASALDAFRRTSRLEPDFALLHLKTSEALGHLGREEESRREFRKAVALDPYLLNQDGRFLEARTLGQSGRAAEALSRLDALAREFPDCYPILMDRANNLALLKRYDDARHELEKALSLWPDSVDALLNLGYVANARGDSRTPSAVLHRLLEIRPDDPRVKAFRDRFGEHAKDAA